MRNLRIDGFTLKWIAMISMLIDHMGAILFPQQLWMRCVGRMAFPIYCFLLVEGAIHTHDIHRYERRLFLFALLSEVPFDLAFYGKVVFLGHQNVFFTLFLGLVMLELLQKGKRADSSFFGVIFALLTAWICQTDYNIGGILIILCFYLLFQYKYWRQAAFAAVNGLWFGGSVQQFAAFAIFPMLLYNGKPGRSMRYFFYIFYPAHLFLLYFMIQVNGG